VLFADKDVCVVLFADKDVCVTFSKEVRPPSKINKLKTFHHPLTMQRNQEGEQL